MARRQKESSPREKYDWAFVALQEAIWGLTNEDGDPDDISEEHRKVLEFSSKLEEYLDALADEAEAIYLDKKAAELRSGRNIQDIEI